jgi:hypothetical protein
MTMNVLTAGKQATARRRNASITTQILRAIAATKTVLAPGLEQLVRGGMEALSTEIFGSRLRLPGAGFK